MTDSIVTAAQFLLTQMDWLRHATDEQGGPYAASVFAEIGECASKMRGVVNGPAEQKYLGPCGAVREPKFNDTGLPCCIVTDCAPHDGPCCNHGDITTCPDDPYEHPWPPAPCDGDVYGRPGARTGRCRTCGAEVDQGERREWLDDVRRDWLYHANEIADAYPKINVNTIRSWLGRGLLVAHGEHDGRPLLKLGEVLDLAAGDAARREEARAARARRLEQRSGGQAA